MSVHRKNSAQIEEPYAFDIDPANDSSDEEEIYSTCFAGRIAGGVLFGWLFGMGFGILLGGSGKSGVGTAQESFWQHMASVPGVALGSALGVAAAVTAHEDAGGEAARQLGLVAKLLAWATLAAGLTAALTAPGAHVPLFQEFSGALDVLLEAFAASMLCNSIHTMSTTGSCPGLVYAYHSNKLNQAERSV
eukprot:CAMPEP_0113944384 /NCGR_PEP_ID=MMETSP1339-20121228/34160_1 /TAXON_ID=94617 /ORGANISM="Fibrocapsa japonica" /LENGTH=190 /DNA_ID=CAMNT_0000949577 /DNA_START=100 /DNA_END=672 /DNA_ORIENTATION=+ /assembly_acc=CAM_ASM_000762